MKLRCQLLSDSELLVTFRIWR